LLETGCRVPGDVVSAEKIVDLQLNGRSLFGSDDAVSGTGGPGSPLAGSPECIYRASSFES
jgi:hypothetical protein